MSNLLHFLTDLATDPKKQRAFVKVPAALMDAAGLSEADKAAIESGDKAKIAAPFVAEFPEIACAAFDPAPDPLPDPDPSPPAEPLPDSEPSDSAMDTNVYQLV